MSRPKTAIYKNFHLYNKLHSNKNCVGLTILYPIKETKYFYTSIEVWANISVKFKIKKDNFNLSVDLPELKDTETIEFLKKHAWNDWVKKNKSVDLTETIYLLDKLFPNKEKIFFSELKDLISAYCSGAFLGELAKYYNHKYNKFKTNIPEIKEKYDKWIKSKDEKDFDDYYKFEEEFVWTHNNIIELFNKIAKNSICYPVYFSDTTAQWWKEKYKSICPYGHAGEIYFTVTENVVYFDINRHF